MEATPPRHLRGPIPIHPATAKARRDGGTVELIFVVGCDGRVDASSVTVRSASDSVFIAPAITAMVAAQYSPAVSKGKKVAMRVLQRVTFDADTYYTRDGTAVSVAEAELLQNWKSPGCELIPRDTLQRVESPPGVEPVRYLSGAMPRYPTDLKRRGITGRVSLRFIVDCNGRVVPSSLIVIGYSDLGFVGPAMRAIESAQFSPAKLNGTPAAQVVEQAIRWQLSGSRAPSPFPAPQPWWMSTCPANTCRSARP